MYDGLDSEPNRQSMTGEYPLKTTADGEPIKPK